MATPAMLVEPGHTTAQAAGRQLAAAVQVVLSCAQQAEGAESATC